jgi:integrase
MLVARYSGARRSNIAGLRWRDIDFTNDLITFPLTKNGRSHTVPLHPAIKAALSEIGPGDASAYVLPRMTLNAVSRAFKRLATRCGMPHLRLHDLRHDCASSLAMGGANQATIMAVLGHRDPRMSARYTHLADEAVREAMLKGLV